ncbi:hypothetical protein [Bosea thiooxidans]|nr:hypothetical protein [Bosea thiooxidans]
MPTVAGGGFGIWFPIERMVQFARADAINAADKTNLAALAASTKVEMVQGALTELRVHVAETDVSKSGLREQVGQVMDLLRDVQNDVGSVNERLDRVIEARQLEPRPQDGFKPP